MSEPEVDSSEGPINVGDLASLVVATSRLLSGLANLPQFSQADVSLAEWLALSVLADKDGISNKILARNLGVTGQRANQLSASLRKAKLISITQAEDDTRRNVIKISETGKTLLDDLNTQLQTLVTGALKKKKRSLGAGLKQVRYLMRIVQVGSPEKAAKMSKRREKKKAAKGGASDASSKG